MSPSVISSSTQALIYQAIHEHALPDSFMNIVENFYFPIAIELNEKINNNGKNTQFLGVQGSQGSGKSTFADFQKIILESEFNKKTLVISIDDFYLTKNERKVLAQKIHPLFETRGVPGTHDVEMLNHIFSKLKNHHLDDESIYIPTFDKAIDDRHPKSNWQKVNSSKDIVILEGWCVGISPQQSKELSAPINKLESEEDQNMLWRTYVNQQLSDNYRTLFAQLDFQISLLAPSFECVFNWRLLQEEKMIAKLVSQSKDTSKTLSSEQVHRFIAHYQRLTEHSFIEMPDKADWLLRLNADHSFNSLDRRG